MKRYLILIALFTASLLVNAQDTIPALEIGKNYRYEFADGSTRMGIFLGEEGEWLLIDDMVLGPIKVRSKTITEVKELVLEEKGMFPNPHFSRQLFGPTAIPQNKGEFYWNNLLLEANTLQYGITNNLSVGLGTGLFSTLAGYPVVLTDFKYSFIINEKNYFALGHFHIFSWLEEEPSPDHYSLSFATYTIGTKEKNFTIGLGAAGYTKYLNDGYNNPASEVEKEFRIYEDPVFYLGTTNRIARNWLFQGEAYAFTFNDEVYNSYNNTYEDVKDLGVILIASFRYIKPSHSWDFAVCYARIGDDNIPLPIFGYTQKF